MAQKTLVVISAATMRTHPERSLAHASLAYAFYQNELYAVLDAKENLSKRSGKKYYRVTYCVL